jgi:hypothetical protein
VIVMPGTHLCELDRTAGGHWWHGWSSDLLVYIAQGHYRKATFNRVQKKILSAKLARLFPPRFPLDGINRGTPCYGLPVSMSENYKIIARLKGLYCVNGQISCMSSATAVQLRRISA